MTLNDRMTKYQLPKKRGFALKRKQQK